MYYVVIDVSLRNENKYMIFHVAHVPGCDASIFYLSDL